MPGRITRLLSRFRPSPVPPPPAPTREEPRIELLFPIGHFYSPIADPAEVRAEEERIFATHDEMPGVDLAVEEQLDLLRALAPHAAGIDYPVEPTADPTVYHYRNDQYPVLDAEFLYAALCHFRPRRMIEVGSGFSSLITADVNRRVLGNELDFTCIEPYPRQFLIDGVPGITRLEREKVQHVPPSFFERLESGDLLFIDSSHVSKVGSDVNYLLFEILPRLRTGVMVHVHDIFLPDEYPRDWVYQGRNWNEQYLLRAFLQHNSAWRVLWAAHFMGTRHRAEVQRTFPRYPELGGGGSMWLRRVE